MGRKKKTTEEFIREAKEVHGDRYDYSKTVYTGAFNKVVIVCPIHGEFKQVASSHLHGQNCPLCSGKYALKPAEKFVLDAKKIHGDKYDYTKVEYRGVLKEVTIICPEHGEFKQKPREHLSGCGCQKCGLKNSWDKRGRVSTDDFINKARKIHGDKYDYSMVEYVNKRTDVEIICHKKFRNGIEHGVFKQKAGDHLRGRGCPHCRNSRLETAIFKFLMEQGIDFEKEKTFDWLVKKQHMYLDFFIPSKMLAIECQGIEHFLPLKTKIKNYNSEEKFKEVCENDAFKKKLCQEHGITILYFSDKSAVKYSNNDEPIYTDKNELLRIICEKKGI